MNYKILDLTQKFEWNKYFSKLPLKQQDIYYTPDYFSFYENYGDGKALCFVFENNEDTALYPFIINSINQLGYKLDDKYYDIQGAYGYNGVVSSSYSKSLSKDFYNAFVSYCEKENIIAEFTRLNPYLSNHRFSEDNLDIILNRKTVILNLQAGYENIWLNSYSSRNRNIIRKANKNRLIFEIDNSIKGVHRFYKIYLNTMNNINADSYYYFNEDMFKSMLNNENFNFLFVKDENNNYLCTMILIIFKEFAHYHLSGRISEIKDNSINNFILDEAVKYSIKLDAKFFHFGGGNSLDDNDSLFKFKCNFSKEYLNFYIGKKIHHSKKYYEVIRQWEEKNPNYKNFSENFLLRYRY